MLPAWHQVCNSKNKIIKCNGKGRPRTGRSLSLCCTTLEYLVANHDPLLRLEWNNMVSHIHQVQDPPSSRRHNKGSSVRLRHPAIREALPDWTKHHPGQEKVTMLEGRTTFRIVGTRHPAYHRARYLVFSLLIYTTWLLLHHHVYLLMTISCIKRQALQLTLLLIKTHEPSKAVEGIMKNGI